MAGIGTRLIDRGFSHPRGVIGRIGGRVMTHANATTERRVIDFADLAPHQVVLILGPGPGIGVQTAAQRCARVVAVDPSDTMLAMCRQRCATPIDRGTVELVRGDAASTGQPDASVDVVVSVNNVMLWPDRQAALAEIRRVLRPTGRMLVSVHQRWLPGGLPALRAAVVRAGFTDVQTWTWEPPGRAASTAAQLRAYAPG